MSSERPVALSVRNLGKTYSLVQTETRHNTLGESLLHRARNPLARPTRRAFNALHDVNFDIRQGDVVGIVGRNGAGKSTLLKLLSRITAPTTGQIDVWGRVGSLLEVGTGFHPELTGRENIYLNGSILGMSRREIDRQFDAIVDFAEVSEFLDTPVKRYSSGMYVRLAFSVAAHLNPEILIVDEVLAVGDAAFQKKCLGKMQDVARHGGRTVLFVSHNMAAVRALCNRAILLRAGTVALDADTDTVVAAYVRDGGEGDQASVTYPAAGAVAPDTMRFTDAAICDRHGSPLAGVVDCRDPFTITAQFAVGEETIRSLRIGWDMQNAEGVTVCGSNNPHSVESHTPGVYRVACEFPGDILNEGRYVVRFCGDIPGDRVLHLTGYELAFSVEDIEGHGATAQKLPGIVRPRLHWSEEGQGNRTRLSNGIAESHFTPMPADTIITQIDAPAQAVLVAAGEAAGSTPPATVTREYAPPVASDPVATSAPPDPTPAPASPPTERGEPLRIGVDVAQLSDHALTGIPLYIESLLREYLESPEPDSWVLVGTQRRTNLAAMLAERGVPTGGAQIISAADYRIGEASPTLGRGRATGWFVSKWDGRLVIPVNNAATSRRVPRLDVFHHTSLLRISPRRARRNIVTIYDLTTRFYPETHNRVNIAEWERIFRFGRDRADMVITDSESARADIIEHLGIGADRVRAIPLGVRPLKTHLPTAQIKATRARVGLAPAARFVLAAGSLEPRKNLPRLIEAFAQMTRDDALDDVRLVITGARLHGAEAVDSAIRQQGIGERVVLTGYLPDDDLAALMTACDCFVYPSVYEGFGLPVLEALALGAPVVTSNTSSLPEVAGDAALLIDPHSTQSIAEGMTRVLEDGDFAADLRRRGPVRAARFSWSACADAHRTLYREVAGR